MHTHDVSTDEHKKPDVLLVYPGERTAIYSNYDFPIGLLYVASSLKKIGVNVSIFDTRIHDISNLKFKKYLFVGVSLLTGGMITHGLKFIKLVKDYDKDIPIVVGGVHPTVLPEQTLKHNMVDYVIIGEGEKTAQELAICLLNNGELSTINGLGYKKDNEIIINQRREFLNMNELDFDLPYESLGLDLSKIHTFPVVTSRGCPHRCAFCYNAGVNRRRYRTKSAPKVIEEIEYIISKYNVHLLDLGIDDEFFINIKRARAIVEYIAKKNLKIRWTSHCRFDTFDKIDDEFLELIKRSGCCFLSFGGESGSQSLLDKIIKKDIKVDQVIRGVERLRKAKISHLVSFMCCLPTETHDDLDATFNLIERISYNNPYYLTSSIFLFAPIPGTELYEFVKKEYNFIAPNSLEEWGKYDLPLSSASLVTWQPKEYAQMCEELYSWSSNHFYIYFSPYNAEKNINANEILYDDPYLFDLMSEIQRLRIKNKYFKHPVEHIIFRNTFRKKNINSQTMISILIPTLNRSEFLIRALRYYIKTGFKGYICIGDSSDAYHAEKANNFIKTVKGQLNIIYQYFPKTVDIALVFKELIDLAPTPYLVFSGDDDLLIPRSLEKCAQFLEGHPEYIAAHGLRIAYKLKTGGEFGQIDHIHYSRQHIWESDKASERWAGYVRDAASTQYYVHRKETWQRMYRDIDSVPDRYLGPEFLPCSLTAISGKVKQLDCLATVFQIQYKDNKPFSFDTTSLFDLATHPDWSESVQGLRKSIVEALMEQDGISEKEANQIFDREFWWHIKSIFVWQYQKKHNDLHQPRQPELTFNLPDSLSVYSLITSPNWSQSIRSTRDISIKALAHHKGIEIEKAQEIFGKEMWYYLLTHLHVQYQQQYGNEPPATQISGENFTHNYEKSLSLESLLEPSSPYHRDFMPVYQIITYGQTER